MFFGHEVKSNNQAKASSMTLETDVKLSQAVLDPSGKGGNKKEPVCLMAEVGGKSFILAVLDPSQSWQCPLDLVLASGTAVKFFLRGQGTVHLTGYEIRDDMGDDLEMSMSSEDEDVSSVEEEEEEAAPVAQKARTPNQAKNIAVKKQTAGKSPATNGVKKDGKPADGKTNGKPTLGGDKQDSDDDSSDDEDFNLEDIDDDDDDELDESDDENLSFGEMDDSDDDMDDLDDDDDDDDEDDD